MIRAQKTMKELRSEQYVYNISLFPFINNWKKNPYTFIKARFYMESSAILVWLLLKTNIKPNTVTIFYCLAGIATGILLSISNNYTILIALGIAFTKGVLDWSDCQLARVKGETSLTGSILDGCGAILNSLGLQIGLGLYVASRLEITGIYYLVALLLFFRASALFIYSSSFLFNEISDKKIISSYLINERKKKERKIEENNSTSILKSKYIKFFASILDDRARSVDFICSIIVLEILFPINISWLLFSLIVIKYFIIFTGSFYIIAKGGWAENKAMNKIRELHILLEKGKN